MVDNGREALKIIRVHYVGSGKPRIIVLYNTLTNLSKGNKESITE